MVAPLSNRLKQELRHPFFGGLFNELNREFGGLFETFDRAITGGFPPVNVAGDDNRVVVSLELPGINPDNLSVDVSGRHLTITGKRATAPDTEPEAWIAKSRSEGEFERRIELPYPVEEDAVKASYKLGVLRVELPRREATKPKKIVIEG